MKEVIKKEILKNINIDKCIKYALKYSKKEYLEVLEYNLDGYMGDGDYYDEYTYLEIGISDYLIKNLYIEEISKELSEKYLKEE